MSATYMAGPVRHQCSKQLERTAQSSLPHLECGHKAASTSSRGCHWVSLGSLPSTDRLSDRFQCHLHGCQISELSAKQPSCAPTSQIDPPSVYSTLWTQCGMPMPSSFALAVQSCMLLLMAPRQPAAAHRTVCDSSCSAHTSHSKQSDSCDTCGAWLPSQSP